MREYIVEMKDVNGVWIPTHWTSENAHRDDEIIALPIRAAERALAEARATYPTEKYRLRRVN